MKYKFKTDYIFYIIIFIITIYLILIGCNSSPLFKGIINKDSAVFQIMAKGLLGGKILYKDLFDHKGPIMYLINAIAILIDKNIGLFIIENLIVYIGTIYLFKTARIMLNNLKSLLICMIYEMLIFLFISGGNFTEEYALTFSSIALYYIMKIIYNLEFSNKKNWIIIGVTFALNFFIKPTYIAIWIAFGISMLIYFIKEKKYKELIKGVLYCIIGICIVLIPIFIYFLITDSISNFINAYFILNAKYSDSSFKLKIKAAIILNKRTKYYVFLIIALISNIIIIINKNIKYYIKIFITIFFVSTIFLTSCAANTFNHYLISNALVISFEVMYLLYILKNIDIPKLLFIIVAIYILVFTLIKVKNNTKNDYNEIEVLNKQQTLDYIKSKYLSSNNEVLVLGNEPYFYIYLNKLPKFKYFFQYPIIIYDKNIGIETENYIRNEKPKILIDALGLDFEKIYGESFKNLIINNYEKNDDSILLYYVLKEDNN